MGDSLFLDEVASFLHNVDNSSGAELQLLDVTPIDDLFTLNNKSFSPDIHTDRDCISVECSSLLPVQDEVVDVRSRDAIRRSTYRQKQKALRDELYQQVEDLSLQLTTLQKKKENEKVRQGVGLAHTAVWKALANRHLKARLLAEEQRRRLHQAVEKRFKLIQDLGQLVRKRMSEEGYARCSTKKPRTKSLDMMLYEAYMKEMDEIYAQTDQVFKDTGMNTLSDDVQGYYKPPPRRVVMDSSYHELVGRSTTPFAYQFVRGQIGRVVCMESRPGFVKVEGTWVPANTTISKAPVLSSVAGGSLVIHTISRRYNEVDRTVVIWRRFAEGEGIFAGLHSDETGWNIVRPSPVEGSVGTLLESIVRFVPINFSSAVSSGGAVRQFTDTIMTNGEKVCCECMQKLGAILLDEAIGVC